MQQDEVRYRVVATVDDFKHRGARFQGMPLTFMKLSETPEGHATDDGGYVFDDAAFDELFTADEAGELVAEVCTKLRGLREVLVERRTRMEMHDAMPIIAIPVGGPNDFWQICEDPVWALPFKAWIYFDTRGIAELTTSHRTPRF